MTHSKFNKKLALVLTLILALSCGMMAGCSKEKKAEEPVEEVNTDNPLTGEADFAGLGQRSVAIVVENSPDARPQWGLDSKDASPDIVLQGEVEGGITRTLWFFSDYNNIPDIVGPIRSARPPFIRFSELFDSVFIHWGQSTTENGYIGANTVFKEDKVDHINQMSYNGKVDLYGRDETRSTSSEHRGILYGDKVLDAIKDKGFRTESEDYSGLAWADSAAPLGSDTCKSMTLTYSRLTDTTSWEYNTEDSKYHCSDFDNDFVRDNLLVLYDTTEYQEKPNYHNSGSSCTYCDYKLDGGKGKYASQGTIMDITWAVEGGKLVLRKPLTEEQKTEYEKAKDEAKEGEEVEPVLGDIVEMNPGKTWIGWASANEGGSLDVTPMPETESSDESSDDSSSESTEG